MDTKVALTPRQIEPDVLMTAQRQVGVAIGAALAFWYLPVVSNVACNTVEQKLISELLGTFGCPGENRADTLFWFVRKKMLLFNAATFIPYAGTSLQILEVYAMGQFVIRCAAQLEDSALSDEDRLRAVWPSIEADIFSGHRVIQSYEEFTKKEFPPAIREPFVATVDALSKVYRVAERVPGLDTAQEFVGEKMRRSIAATTSAFRWVVQRAGGRS